MNDRDRIAGILARKWPEGVCHFCSIRDEQVDGDRVRWLRVERSVCSQPGCVCQFSAAIDRALGMAKAATRRRSPAEIHELKKQEWRELRQKYRQARQGKRTA